MSPAKAHRYLVSFLRLGVVAQDPLSGRYELGGFALQLGLARLARIDGVKLARIALAELRRPARSDRRHRGMGQSGADRRPLDGIELSGESVVEARRRDAAPDVRDRAAVRRVPAARQNGRARRARACRHAPFVAGRTVRAAHDEVERALEDVRAHGAARVEGMLLPTIHAFCTRCSIRPANWRSGSSHSVMKARSIFAGMARSIRRCGNVRRNCRMSSGIVRRRASACAALASDREGASP